MNNETILLDLVKNLSKKMDSMNTLVSEVSGRMIAVEYSYKEFQEKLDSMTIKVNALEGWKMYVIGIATVSILLAGVTFYFAQSIIREQTRKELGNALESGDFEFILSEKEKVEIKEELWQELEGRRLAEDQ